MTKTKTKTKRFSWKTAALKLAQCVVATIKSDGKIGMGTGMVMYRNKDGTTRIERWDKDFIEALAYIGVEVVEKPKVKKSVAQPKRAP